MLIQNAGTFLYHEGFGKEKVRAAFGQRDNFAKPSQYNKSRYPIISSFMSNAFFFCC